jgi:DDE superfamily endonuclease
VIEDAYRLGEAMGLPVWCTDQAGPFQTTPYPGRSWRPAGEPARLPHEYLRDGTAKVLTLFHPADGRLRVQGVTSCPNAVLHPWLKRELAAILAGMPEPGAVAVATIRRSWERRQDGLTVKPTLLSVLPPLRMLLVLDNLAGHKTPAFVCRLFEQGIMPLYTPVGGSWRNMAESIPRVLRRRALDGQHPGNTGQILAWFEAVAGHWNAAPTPFVWGGKRAARRQRQRERRHRVGGSGAYTRVPIRRVPWPAYGYRQGK